MSEFLSPEQARATYDLRIEQDNEPSEIERALAEQGIAAIQMPLSPSDFHQLSEGFALCIEECPELLTQTDITFDHRFGMEAGYTRKERKVSRSGIQISDPKSYMHFSEQARDVWKERFAKGPQILKDFLADGFEIQDALITVAKSTIAELENTHPGSSELYFPGGKSLSFLRLLRYDGYEPDTSLAEVAKPHYDIGGVTIQAYADAPGFWAAKDGVHGERVRYDTEAYEAYTFLGKGHEKIYGKDDHLKSLWHGVDRIIPAGITWVPDRTAVILFVDAPEVDFQVKSTDTLPQLSTQIGSRGVKDLVII